MPEAEHSWTAYFKTWTRFIEDHKELHDQIVDVIKSVGLKVIPESEIFLKYHKKDMDLFYKEASDTIKDCDIFISEASISSSSTGYQIANALAMAKPVLVLQNKDLNPTRSVPILVNPSKLVSLNTYSLEDLPAKLKSFLKKAHKGIFVKRLPIEFTQDQVEYVQYKQGLGARKSFNATVRELIDQARVSDKEYLKFTEIQD